MVFFIHSSPPPFSPPPPPPPSSFPSFLSSSSLLLLLFFFPLLPPPTPLFLPPSRAGADKHCRGLGMSYYYVSLGLSYYYVHRVFKGLSLPLLLCFIFKGQKMRQNLILRAFMMVIDEVDE